MKKSVMLLRPEDLTVRLRNETRTFESFFETRSTQRSARSHKKKRLRSIARRPDDYRPPVLDVRYVIIHNVVQHHPKPHRDPPETHIRALVVQAQAPRRRFQKRPSRRRTTAPSHSRRQRRPQRLRHFAERMIPHHQEHYGGRTVGLRLRVSDRARR